jgi:hypothetical protein
VIVRHYAIYWHLLWRVLGKDDWTDHQRVLKALNEPWDFFWGSIQQPRYFWAFSETEQTQSRSLLQPQHAHVRLLVSLRFVAREMLLQGHDKERITFRDIAIGILTRRSNEITPETVERSSRRLIELLPVN